MTKIIVDSTSDLPDSIVEEYDIDVLPLRIYIEGEEYLDNVTISVDEVYDAMRKGLFPKTSQPNPKDTYELFRKYASAGKNFIFYTISSKLSGTYETCHQIIQELKGEYPNVKMGIVDTKSGSLAIGLIVLQAAKMARKGISYDEIVSVSNENARYIEHIFTINDLSWLLKGGRISKGSAIIGGILDIKPILDLQEGKIQVIRKVRGHKKLLMTVLDIVKQRIKEFPNQMIGIAHADDLNNALAMKEMIIEKLGNCNILIEKIGSVLGTHLGIGGVGVFFFNKKPEIYI